MALRRMSDIVNLSCLVSNVYFNVIVQDSLCVNMDIGTIPRSNVMGPAWGPSGADRTQVGPMLAPWTLLSGIWHCVLVSCIPSQSIGLFLGCGLFWCWVSLCVRLLIPWYSSISSWWLRLSLEFFWPFYQFWTTHFDFLWPGTSGSATTHLLGFFCPWTFSLLIGLNMLPSDSFMSCLDFLPGYSTGEFRALQLIALAVFGAVD